MSESRGRSSETSLRLCSRAPRMISWSATVSSGSRRLRTCVPMLAGAGGSLASAPRPRVQPSHAAPTDPPSPTAMTGGAEGWHRSAGTGRPKHMSAEVVPADVPARLQAVEAASDRLLATVEGLSVAGFAEPSVLPDWTRAHVVAHLALNAEGLSAALSGLAAGEPRPIYASDEARDNDIDALAATDPELVRVRLHTGVVTFGEAVRRVPMESWSGTVDRLPGGPHLAALETLPMRHREVEIHHADLHAGYAHAD